jgi:hypothetical protein
MTDQAVLPLQKPRSAVISPCGTYRYLLTRQLGTGTKIATFIMLNPSTADAERDDPTIRKCIGFARRWECGKLLVVNLFAFRATDPADLRRTAEPAGRENVTWIGHAIHETRLAGGLIVCAWGTHGAHRDQDLYVLGLLDSWKTKRVALGLTKYGHPKHPLYAPYAAPLLPFVGSRP